MNDLRFACPSCGRKLAPVYGYTHATQHVKRTCPNRDCRETWAIKVEPLGQLGKIEGARADMGTFTFLGRR